MWSGVLSLSDPSRRRFDQRALPTQCRGRLAAWFGDTSSSHRCLESRSITLFFRREDTSVGHSLRANHRIALPDKQKQTVRCPPPSGRIFFSSAIRAREFSCNVASGNYLGFTLSYFPYCVKGHFELPTTLVTLPKGQFPRNPTARCPNTCGDNRQLPAPQSVRHSPPTPHPAKFARNCEHIGIALDQL